jgi:hypothetical protein
MRRLLLSIILLLSPLPWATPTHAADPAPAMPAPTAPELYKRAVGHLNEGLWFESAIADLTQAVKLDRSNSDYHLALGCAEADRAGSLAYAAWMSDQLLNAQAKYKEELYYWHLAQAEPQSPGYGQPEPVAPPDMTFQVKDDLHHLTLTGKEAVARVVELGTAAQADWRLGVLLAPTRQTRAQAENVQGWGLLYELRLLQFTGYPEAKVPSAPKPINAVAAFLEATKDDPGKAVYWEGLGDAYSDLDSDDTAHAPDIIHAWQKALTLAPGNTGLGFRLYEVQSRFRDTGKQPDPKAAMATLKAVAASDPTNSLLQYGLAALLFKQVHYNDVNDLPGPAPTKNGQPATKEDVDTWRNGIVQNLAAKDDASSEQIASEAVDAIERGNAGDHYAIPEYAPPVPKILQRPWDYWDYWERLQDGPFVMSAKLRELARAASGYSLVAAQRGNGEDAVRTAQACIGIGFKMAGDWSFQDASGNSTAGQVLVGTAIVSIGYDGLQKVYGQLGNAAMVQETAQEYDAFKQKRQAYTDAFNKLIQKEEAAGPAPVWDHY